MWLADRGRSRGDAERVRSRGTIRGQAGPGPVASGQTPRPGMSNGPPRDSPAADDCVGPDERAVEAAIGGIIRGGGWPIGRARAAIEVGRRYRAARSARIAAGGRPRIAVGCWELSHNAAGRAQILAELHRGRADVEILGCRFPQFGPGLWEPLRSLSMPPVHAIEVDDPAHLPRRIVGLVLGHPCDLVHLSKPRMPNILLGLAARAIWGAAVVVDVDDDELSFTTAESRLDLAALVAGRGGRRLPRLERLNGREWTRFAEAMATEFDAVTVVNEPLRQRYGGVLVRHARSLPSPGTLASLRDAERKRLGIALDRPVVLFLGTPRAHKGLLETARLVVKARCPEALFLVIGDFAEAKLRRELEAISGVELRLLGNQPFERLTASLAAGDIHVSILDESYPVSAFQTPAKLTDALGAGLAVTGRPSPGTADILEGIGAAFATLDEVAVDLARLLREPELRRRRARAGRAWYDRFLTIEANSDPLTELVQAVLAKGPTAFRAALAEAPETLLGRMLGTAS